MATVNRCFNCFAVKLSDGVCAHCGHSGDIAHHPSALPPGTQLEGRFLIGKTLGQASSLGFIYVGWCMTRQERIIIQEYLPRGVASRNLRNGHVTVYAETRDTFAQGLSTFAATGKQLAKVNSPHVARIREQFAARDTGYRVLDQLASDTLITYLQRRGSTLAFTEAAHICLQLVDALEALNGVGATQTDIAAENILYAKDNLLLAGISWSKTNSNEISLVNSETDLTRIAGNTLQLFAHLVTGLAATNPAARSALTQMQANQTSATARLLDMAKSTLQNPEQPNNLGALRTLLTDVKLGTTSEPVQTSRAATERSGRRLATPLGIAVALGCTVTVMVQMLSSGPEKIESPATATTQTTTPTAATEVAEATPPPSATEQALNLVSVPEAHASIAPAPSVVPQVNTSANTVAKQIESQAPAAGSPVVATTSPTTAATTSNDLTPVDITPVVVAVATTEVAAPAPAKPAVSQEASQALNQVMATPLPPAQPEPSPEEKKIAELFEKATRAEKQKRWIEPAKDNASKYYREILKLDSDNADAKTGLEKIASHYLNDATEAMAKLDWNKAEQALKKADTAMPKSADVERMRVVMKAAQAAQKSADVAQTEPSETNASEDKAPVAAEPKLDIAAINALRQEAQSNGLPIISIHYENGNQRKTAFAISNLGETSLPKSLTDSTYTFVWPGTAKSAWVVFEQRKGKGFHFDWPLALNLQRDLSNYKVAMDGVDVINVYVNNQLEIGNVPNFGKKNQKPKELLGSKGSVAKPFDGATIYLRGTMNDWDVTTPMNYVGNFTYVTEVDLSDSQNYEFKFADEAWSSNINFGSDFRTKGKGLQVGPEAQNLNFWPNHGDGKYEYAFFSIPTHEGFYNFYRVERKSSGGSTLTTANR